MSIKRFMWCRPAGGAVMHIKYGNTVEGPTKCGVHAAPGWIWQLAEVWRKRKDLRECKRCCP